MVSESSRYTSGTIEFSTYAFSPKIDFSGTVKLAPESSSRT
jgi:hypothetical protein